MSPGLQVREQLFELRASRPCGPRRVRRRASRPRPAPPSGTCRGSASPSRRERRPAAPGRESRRRAPARPSRPSTSRRRRAAVAVRSVERLLQDLRPATTSWSAVSFARASASAAAARTGAGQVHRDPASVDGELEVGRRRVASAPARRSADADQLHFVRPGLPKPPSRNDRDLGELPGQPLSACGSAQGREPRRLIASIASRQRRQDRRRATPPATPSAPTGP